jgi:hypothetical protein
MSIGLANAITAQVFLEFGFYVAAVGSGLMLFGGLLSLLRRPDDGRRSAEFWDGTNA